MTVISDRILFKRNLVITVLISVFVTSVFLVTLSIYIINPQKKDKITGRPNILFIVIDDLRPTLGCYGDKKAITPNIDQLASKSMLFQNAYAQQALCGPSRTSFLTSRRPDSLHLYDVGSYWRNSVGNFTTLPQHFKNHGYETISIGKIFHHGIVSNKTDDYPYSWSELPYHPSTQKYKMHKVCKSPDGQLNMNLMCPVDIKDQPEKSLPDIQNMEYAVNYLKNRKKGPNKLKNFFLGLGFYKPHIPFKFPSDYMDLYPLNSMDLAPNNTKSPKLPDVAWNPWTDIRQRDDVDLLNVSFPYGPLPDEFQKIVRQGYYASLSYMDDQLGKVLAVLEETGYFENTIIILFGDHGWSLGEHQEWSKYSNFEVSLRVPLLMYVPGLVENGLPFKHIPVLSMISNKKISEPPIKAKFQPKYITNEFVELVDIFPTLAELAGLPIPPLCVKNYSSDFCTEGISFFPLLEENIPQEEFSWKSATFSQYPRPSPLPQNNSDQPTLKDIHIMGYSIRNSSFRYTQWVSFNQDTFKPNWGDIIGRELYDHRVDPFEANNVWEEEEYANYVNELSALLATDESWRYVLPPNVLKKTKAVSSTFYNIFFNILSKTVYFK